MTHFLFSQVADFDWPHKHVPDLEKLVDLCRNLDSWLRADPQNIIVVHCHVRGEGEREKGREGEREKGREGRREGEREGGKEGGRKGGREGTKNECNKADLFSIIHVKRDCPVIEAFHVCEEKGGGGEESGGREEGYGEGGCTQGGRLWRRRL